MTTIPSQTNFFHQIRLRERKAQITSQASYFTPSLVQICALVVAQDFSNQPSIDHLPPDLQTSILNHLSTSLPITVTVPRIEAEEYWKSCCEARWSAGQLALARNETKEEFTWKRLFLERYLGDYLASLNDEYPTTAASTVDLMHLLQLSAKWIRKLHITRLKCHLDMEDLVVSLPKLSALQVTYGVLNSGMQFESKMFGIRPADCLQFAAILRQTKTLTFLCLPENQIDGDKLKALLTGLVKNFSVTHLDLSHNKIPDAGAKALATLLLRKPQTLQHLNLMDNCIRSDGGAAFGRSLSLNDCLTYLNLRLNRLGDDGGAAIFDGLRTNSTLKELNLANNELGAESARLLSDLLRVNTTLASLDVSGNVFGEAAGSSLVDAMEANTGLRAFDVRMSGLRQQDQYVISDLLRQRAAKPL